mgnify:CR=1 FL=1|tara:strand:- start:100 stop:336 length:237 start_codon:yes stop_codon:yes gene_type:complete
MDILKTQTPKPFGNVIRNGDIPEIDSACNPKRDSTLFSAEYFSAMNKVPENYLTEQDKTVIDLKIEGAVVVSLFYHPL